MHIFKINCKKLSLWILTITQIFLITSYYYLQKGETTQFKNGRISFLNTQYPQSEINKEYHTKGDIIELPKYKTKNTFYDFNSSLCFITGTDFESMKQSKNSWNCICKKGWHGTECGQPEVIWRAILAYRKRMVIKGPTSFARRIVYIFKVDEFLENLVDIRINELQEVIDLFILIENEGNRIEKLLKDNFLKNYHKKIFYLKNVLLKDVWSTITSSVPDLENNDIIIMSKSFEIPNKFALSFLKYYDNWPEPIFFRLRWSVFGFFWKHPLKTVTRGVLCSIKFMKENFDSNFENLYSSKNIAGLLLGDLNHYGGWYCEYCIDPIQIIKFLTVNSNIINWKQLNNNKIDANYIEDLIGIGLYIDGKTELERSRKYQDNYFAPSYVLNNSVKFDTLINVYIKMDYYEG